MTALVDKPERSPAPARRRWSRADVILGVLVIAHLVLAWMMYDRVTERTVIGDEKYYIDAARALSNLVRDLASFHGPHWHELRDNVVGNGWFMPGTSLLLTPLFLVLPHAEVDQWRLYVTVVTSVLFIVALLDVRRVLGRWYAVGVAALPGLIPMWVLFGSTAYGDMPAGILLLFLVSRLVELMRTLAAGRAPTLRQGVVIGLVAIAALYVRGSTLPLIGGLLVGALAATIWLLRGRERRRGLAALAAATGVFVVLLLPWSVGASVAMDSRVVTTTSVPLGLGNTFGDADNFCFGPCDPDSTTWFAPVRYAREVARATGLSEVEIQQQMSSYALRDLTVHTYAKDVLRDFGNYIHTPGAYAEVLHPPNVYHGAQLSFIEDATLWMFRIVLVGGVLALLLVARRRYDDQVLSIAVKLVIGALLLQPFVHVAGSRYWPTVAPMAILGLVLALRLALARWRPAADLGGPEVVHPPSKALTWVQGILVAGVVLVAGALVVLSR